MEKIALVTGFEPYGGRRHNPSARLAEALHGKIIGAWRVEGRVLPVALDGLEARIEALLEELRPSLVLALGLAPGEAMIRLERVALNLADFGIADNAGARPLDRALVGGSVMARAASLPLRAMEDALLAQGIPVRLSSSAGTYLCNAVLYLLLQALELRGEPVPCGFIHLPYLPEQVAEMLDAARAGRLEIGTRADVASMDYGVMERALRIVLEALGAASGGGASR